MKTSPQRRRGFTLIEIMIVVAIIGMLAVIAVPNYARARDEAQKTTCVTNLREIDGAVQLWAMEQKKTADQAVAYGDVSSYLKGSVVCPAGGTSFADSYALTIVDAKPTCLRKPASHLLPQ